jgi:hypothetical protein
LIAGNPDLFFPLQWAHTLAARRRTFSQHPDLARLISEDEEMPPPSPEEETKPEVHDTDLATSLKFLAYTSHRQLTPALINAHKDLDENPRYL